MYQAQRDTDLMSAVASGSHAALGVLYDRYGGMVHGIALRVVGDAALAEEVTQDVFLKVWRMAARFDSDRGRVATWLLNIARNTAIDTLRARRGTELYRAGPLEEVRPVTDPGPAVEAQAEAALMGTLVREALMRLAPEQRQVLEMAYFHGLTHQEIANETRTPLGTVKSRLRLALSNLRTLLTTPNRKGAYNHGG